MRRNWIKIYVDQCLRGTMMDELTPEERWVWIGFLLLAGDSPFEGKIAITKNIGYTDEQLSELLKCSTESIKNAKLNMIKYGKISVSETGIIKILNWQKYQSEYGRLRKYREKKPSKSTKKSTKKSTEENTNSSLSLSPSSSLSYSKSFKEEIINKWNDFAKEYKLSTVIDVLKGSVREKNLKARVKDGNFDFDILIEKIKKQPFLYGKNKKGWAITFDWIILPSNYQKILEEQYIERQGENLSDQEQKERQIMARFEGYENGKD